MSALQGIVAGTVGTAVLDAVTYADMAVTGRAASSAPTHTVIATAAGLGLDLPADGPRTDAYGPLGGLAAGAAVGVLAATARRIGLRLPLLAEAAVVGAAAMVATDGPMHWSGVTDVRTWSAGDWARDVVPHLAFGLAVSGTLRALERDDDASARGGSEGGTSVTVPGSVADDGGPSRRRVLARSLAVGLATGARSTLALVPPAASSGRVALAVGAAGMVAGELTVDKLPSTPSRLAPAPALARVALGAVGAVSVARRQGDGGALLPLLAGAAGAMIGTVGGHAFRGLCAERGAALPGALAEDALALGLTAWATRG